MLNIYMFVLVYQLGVLSRGVLFFFIWSGKNLSRLECEDGRKCFYRCFILDLRFNCS